LNPGQLDSDQSAQLHTSAVRLPATSCFDTLTLSTTATLSHPQRPLLFSDATHGSGLNMHLLPNSAQCSASQLTITNTQKDMAAGAPSSTCGLLCRDPSACTRRHADTHTPPFPMNDVQSQQSNRVMTFEKTHKGSWLGGNRKLDHGPEPGSCCLSSPASGRIVASDVDCQVGLLLLAREDLTHRQVLSIPPYITRKLYTLVTTPFLCSPYSVYYYERYPILLPPLPTSREIEQVARQPHSTNF
jgi:hypothetical protein